MEYNVGKKMNDILDEVVLEGRWCWVKAHTDGQKPEQIINRFSDELAEIAHNDKEITTTDPANGRPILQLHGREISSRVWIQIVEYAMEVRSKSYWKEKEKRQSTESILYPARLGDVSGNSGKETNAL